MEQFFDAVICLTILAVISAPIALVCYVLELHESRKKASKSKSNRQ